MSYTVKLTDEVVRKLSGFRLSTNDIREIRAGLNVLAHTPQTTLDPRRSTV